MCSILSKGEETLYFFSGKSGVVCDVLFPLVSWPSLLTQVSQMVASHLSLLAFQSDDPEWSCSGGVRPHSAEDLMTSLTAICS